MTNIVVPNYLDAIASSYPTLNVRCNGSATEYANLTVVGGETLPSKENLDAIILEMKRARMWLVIQDERTRRQAGGVFISSIGKWFHSDQPSRIQQLGLVMMGANMPSIQWKTMDGGFVTMTPSLALAIFNAAATLDMQAFAAAEQHRAQMNAAADPATYNFSGGWPAIFGG